MRLLPRSLLRQNLLLIAALVVAAQLATAFAFYYLMQRPRAVHTVQLAVQQIRWLQDGLASMPPPARQHYVEQINHSGVATLIPADGAALAGSEVPKSLGMRMFVRSLRRELARAGIDSHWRNDPPYSLYIRVQLGDAPYWFRLSMAQLDSASIWPWLVALLVSAVLTMAGAFAIQRRISRPLTDLVDAARQLGQGHYPARLPEDGVTEIATVAGSFNQMVGKLAQLDKERALMLAGVSHDLRTPLAKLSLAVSLLESQSDPALVAQIQRHVDEMDGLIGQFIDFARIGTDEAPAPVDLAAMLRQLAGYFEQQGAHFHLELDGLPVVTSRPAAIRRALVNLMDNAVKYGASADGHAELAIHARINGGYLSLSVLDRGPGLADCDLARLAEPFVRGSEARQGKPGTGLGLAIVERIARLHGGELRLAPRAGGGLEATMTLQRAGQTASAIG